MEGSYLALDIKEAINLQQASSDVYVELLIKYGNKPDEHYRTIVVHASTEPEWNEKFNVNIMSGNESLLFKVMQKEIFRGDSILGEYHMRSIKIPYSDQKMREREEMLERTGRRIPPNGPYSEQKMMDEVMELSMNGKPIDAQLCFSIQWYRNNVDLFIMKEDEKRHQLMKCEDEMRILEQKLRLMDGNIYIYIYIYIQQ